MSDFPRTLRQETVRWLCITLLAGCTAVFVWSANILFIRGDTTVERRLDGIGQALDSVSRALENMGHSLDSADVDLQNQSQVLRQRDAQLDSTKAWLDIHGHILE